MTRTLLISARTSIHSLLPPSILPSRTSVPLSSHHYMACAPRRSRVSFWTLLLLFATSALGVELPPPPCSLAPFAPPPFLVSHHPAARVAAALPVHPSHLLMSSFAAASKGKATHMGSSTAAALKGHPHFMNQKWLYSYLLHPSQEANRARPHRLSRRNGHPL